MPPTLIKKNFSQYGIPGPTKKSNTKGKKFKYLYPIGHDEIHYCISNFFAMCGVVMICSLYDVQLMVRYKLCKLIGVVYRYVVSAEPWTVRNLNRDSNMSERLHKMQAVLGF